MLADFGFLIFLKQGGFFSLDLANRENLRPTRKKDGKNEDT
jgi:hypothetical protein